MEQKTVKISSVIPEIINKYKIILVKKDSLTTANIIKKCHPTKNILILNFANNENFCDGKTLRSDFSRRCTQEEDIVRRSDLEIQKELYPISDANPEKQTILLTKPVNILKNKYGKNIDPFTVDIVSSAALMCPRYITINYDSNKHDYKYEDDKLVMFRRMENIVKLATHYDIFITGAWGLGQFCNPTYGLIKIWNKTLKNIAVKHVFFAIPDDKTYKLFRKFLKYDYEY